MTEITRKSILAEAAWKGRRGVLNLICKVFGHKWRDTSHWEFKREDEKQVRRKITQMHCDRCNETKVFKINRWQPDIPIDRYR